MVKVAPNPAPEFLRPKLRLFLSVDLVGSTRFKQEAGRDPCEGEGQALFHPWLGVVTDFYREFDRLFREEWAHFAGKYKGTFLRSGAAPEFWKATGDELLYSKVLTHHSEALSCLHVFLNTVRTYRRTLIEKPLKPELSLKATAWVGGFPVINSEVIVAAPGSLLTPALGGADPLFENMRLVDQWYRGSRKSRDVGLLDFVGPSIDIGFRLAANSTERRAAISVELALMLVQAQFSAPQCPYEPLRVVYSGGTVLKGVLDSHPYPWFWLDLQEAAERNGFEDGLLNSQPDVIKQFCEDFLGRCTHPSIVRPYIDFGDDVFGLQPIGHNGVRARLLEYWHERQEILKAEGQLGGGRDRGPVAPNDAVKQVVAGLPADSK